MSENPARSTLVRRGGSDELTRFRTAYLRAIATAWADETDAFLNELTAEVDHEKQTGAIYALQKRWPDDFEWPWEDAVDLKVTKRDKDLMWVGDDWVWTDGLQDTLNLYVPLNAERAGVRDGKRVLAIADYHRARPSVFGDGAWSSMNARLFPAPREGNGGGSGSGDLFGFVLNTVADIAPAAPIGPTGPVHYSYVGKTPAQGFVPDQNGFLNVGVALLSVMAKAWENENFAEAVKKDAGMMLQAARGYKPPWSFAIKIKDDKHAHWVENDSQPWHNLKRHRIELAFPTRPNASDFPVALAGYNATGAEFPFTCCP